MSSFEAASVVLFIKIKSNFSSGKESNMSAKIARLLATNVERLHNCQGYQLPNLH